jgi:apolipoprotein N-acyltransferase
VAASALAFSLYARVESPWFALGFVGLVPWLAALDRAASMREALAAGLCMCVAFALAVFFWFAGAVQAYTGAPIAVGIGVLILAAPLLQPQFVVFALARGLLRGRDPGLAGFLRLALGGAGVYVGAEWAIPKLFADTLGHGLYASALLRQAADLAGAHGLTFALVVSNECALAIVRAALDAAPLRVRLRSALPPALGAAALVLAPLAYGALRLREIESAAEAGTLAVAGIVQADISRYGHLAAELGTFDAVRAILDAHFALSSAATAGSDVDLLVWPETVYPTTFGSPKSAEGAAFDSEIGAFVAGLGIPLVFGAYDVDGGQEFNAAVFLEPAPRGQPLTFATYRKTSLFPLTERVPRLLESDLVRGLFPWLGSWRPGAGPEVVGLRLRNGRSLRVAPLICYDAVDPGFALAAVRDGAELLLTLSNDSWFSGGAGAHLHLVVSAFRSIETRRPQVRATNTGISAVIAPSGELLGTLGVHERGFLATSVPAGRPVATLMLAWGDWFGPSALVFGAVGLAAALTGHPPGWRRRRRPRRG